MPLVCLRAAVSQDTRAGSGHTHASHQSAKQLVACTHAICGSQAPCMLRRAPAPPCRANSLLYQLQTELCHLQNHTKTLGYVQVGAFHACLVSLKASRLDEVEATLAHNSANGTLEASMVDNIRVAGIACLQEVLLARAAGHIQATCRASLAGADYPAAKEAVLAYLPEIVAGRGRFLTTPDQAGPLCSCTPALTLTKPEAGRWQTFVLLCRHQCTL